MALLQNSVFLKALFRSRRAAGDEEFSIHPDHPSNLPRWHVRPGQVAIAVALTLTYGSLAYLLAHASS